MRLALARGPRHGFDLWSKPGLRADFQVIKRPCQYLPQGTSHPRTAENAVNDADRANHGLWQRGISLSQRRLAHSLEA